MDLGWKYDNPADVLEKYYKDINTFAEKSDANDVLEKELSAKQSEQNSKKEELRSLKERLDSMGVYEAGDIDASIQKVDDDAQRNIERETKKFDDKKNDLSDQKDKDVQDNDSWLKSRLEQLLSGSGDLDRELTEAEKKALEFETDRRQFVIKSNEKINEYQDAVTQEQLDCQTLAGELKKEQDEVYAKYEPDLTSYKEKIDSINKKFEPDIRSCQDLVSEKVADRNEDLGQLQNERERELQLADQEIEEYRREFKKTERQFNEQIRMAKIQNKPTTRMQNSKVSRLNAINDQIQKVNNRVNKKIASIDLKIETEQKKHTKIIGKAESQLNMVICSRDQELSEPTNMYNSILKERDAKTAALQSKIDQREDECNTKTSSLNSSITLERQAQDNHNANIDKQIVDYVMSGETCFSDVLNEDNRLFAALQGRISVWMEMLSAIKKDKMTAAYQTEHERQKEILSSMSYSQLQDELAQASLYNNQLSAFSKNNRLFMIAGGALTVSGLALVVVLYAILKMTAGLAGIAVAAIGIALAVLTVSKTRKEFAFICRYVSLASDYQEFPSITEHSAQITQERELAKMKSMGGRLYDIHYGRCEAQNIHDAKDADLKADYARNLKLITKEFENAKAQIERERDHKIKQIKEDAAEREADFISEKEKMQSQIRALTVRVEKLEAGICELRNEMELNSQFIEAFESNYHILEKQLNNKDWIAPMSYTHGKLNDALYIIPENGERDRYDHRKIYLIEHHKKALVLNYDISKLPVPDAEQTNHIIRSLMYDLMYSIYRMNSEEIYQQFIIDEMACTDSFKESVTRNAFKISEFAGRVDEIRGRLKAFLLQRDKIANKGTTMDELNESKFKNQDRPEKYNILYIIYKQDGRKGRLDDDIRKLIPECEKYGFLPIFICEKNTWEEEIQEKESMYKEIKALTNNQVMVFDGHTYYTAL